MGRHRIEPIREQFGIRDLNLKDFKIRNNTKFRYFNSVDPFYLNGELVGHTGYKYPPRRYPVPKGILKPGKNTVTVRLVSTESTGGFVKDMLN